MSPDAIATALRRVGDSLAELSAVVEPEEVSARLLAVRALVVEVRQAIEETIL